MSGIKDSPAVHVGDIIEVQTERLAYGGEAVAHYHGLAIFVPFAAAGETARVRITERKKNFARAAIESILLPSVDRREPLCPYFGECGGCQLQHITYTAQLSAKAAFIADALKRIGRIEWPHEIEIRSAAEFGYRTRAQIKIASHGPRPGERSRREGQDQDPRANSVREMNRTRFSPHQSPKGDAAFCIGFNRISSHIICDVVTCPVLVPELDSALGNIRQRLAADAVSSTACPREVALAAGDDRISCEPAVAGLPSGAVKQKIRGIEYHFDPRGFFQGNRFLLEDLVDAVTQKESGDFAIDLYAGAGLFAGRLGQSFNEIIAVESEPESAALGQQNMTANGLRNVQFINERAEGWLKRYLKSLSKDRMPRADLIVLDPPRGGAMSIVKDLLSIRPDRMTYVSCDPVTLSRDLGPLSAQYDIVEILGFDLFPQTYHVEVVVRLRLKR